MKELQIGMVGLDTSHVTGLAGCFNDPENAFHIAGARIVKAFPGGSATFSLSRNRIGRFTAELSEKYGVGLVDSIGALGGMDAFLLESVDGAQHFEQFRILAEFGRPVYIDKPLACCYADAKRIFELAQEKRIPIMTASSMRYAAGVGDVLPPGTAVAAAEGFGPLEFLPDYRDYFWYGIHTAELLYRYLGRGCMEVRTISHGGMELAVGLWEDGRVGQITGNHAGSRDFGVRLVTGTGHVVSVQNPDIPYLYPMASAILEFFRSGISPIDPAESLEIIAFLEAASRSRAAGGKPVALKNL
ncbi:MAG: gfo/Idh/MocA family oxidoreductase [Lentisphaeria bacterium]|nr:gfo/Idh/MocA family oxidoreductase [Lentisphaeria bacterium]